MNIIVIVITTNYYMKAIITFMSCYFFNLNCNSDINSDCCTLNLFMKYDFSICYYMIPQLPKY